MSSSTIPTYPKNKLVWDLNPEDIAKRTDELIAKSKAVMDKVAALPKDSLTFENTVKALADDDGESETLFASADFPMYVSTDKAVRDASQEAQTKFSKFAVDANMREDVYQTIKAFADSPAGKALTGIDARLLKKTLEDFERNGLGASPEVRAKVKEMKQELSKASIDFSANLNTESAFLEFPVAEVAGMPEDWIKDRTQENGNVKITLKYPDIIPLMKNCSVASTRKAMDKLNGNKAPANVPIIKRMIQLRQEFTKLLGYDTYAHWQLEPRMAKNPEAVMSFLTNLREKLIPGGKAEIETLTELKKKDCAERGIEFDGKLHAWDFGYYNNLLLKTKYQVDDAAIAEYFPMDVVTKGMLDIYQEILGLKFYQVPDAKLWHEDVSMYAVADAESGKVIGEFYMDLHPRENKYGHAAAFGLHPGYVTGDGTRQLPASVMVANFTKPTAEKPSLLKHNEVITFFHEFGHIMHGICTTARWMRFAGTRVERDFVEAPSQMLENWCWEPEVLARISGHYKDKSKPLPKDMLDKMVAAKNVNVCLLTLRQVFYATYDQTAHGKEMITDTAALWKKLRAEITLFEQQDDTDPIGGWGHIGGGYQAQYYGYLWSQVFSADMYYSQFKTAPEGVLSKSIGAKYREHILAPGGSQDSSVGLKAFLGRDPDNANFLKAIGLSK